MSISAQEVQPAASAAPPPTPLAATPAPPFLGFTAHDFVTSGERFALIGQDRGGRVGHRMALDHPDAVTRAVFIDIVPTYYLYTHVTLDFVQAYYHSFSLLRRAPIPETRCVCSHPLRLLNIIMRKRTSVGSPSCAALRPARVT